MDGIYLYNKYGKPVTWDQWVSVREILDYVLTIWKGKQPANQSCSSTHLLPASGFLLPVRANWAYRTRYVDLGSEE